MEGKVLSDEIYNTQNVYMAVPFLSNIQKKLLEKVYDKKYEVKGKRVIVVGGGDTAMDCVRTSVREGASNVQCVYRRNESSMPGSKKEVAAAKEEGVEFVYFSTPKNFVATPEGKVIGINFVKTELATSQYGRADVREVPGSEHVLEADVFILALGFNNEKLRFLQENGVATNEWGAIAVQQGQETSKTRVFAGGDAVRGADLVVTAALDGREAAMQILEQIFAREGAAPVGAVTAKA